jgi:hypothetical protein
MLISSCGTLSWMRRQVCNLLVQLLLGLASVVTLWSKTLRTCDHILLLHLRLGSHFVASYTVHNVIQHNEESEGNMPSKGLQTSCLMTDFTRISYIPFQWCFSKMYFEMPRLVLCLIHIAHRLKILYSYYLFLQSSIAVDSQTPILLGISLSISDGSYVAFLRFVTYSTYVFYT